MIHLAAGTTKYLLFHPSRVERNTERAKVGEPVVFVVEVGADDKRSMHRGYALLTEGPVAMAYSQRDPLLKLRYDPSEEDVVVHAAYVTHSAVVLAESPDEPLEFAAQESEPEEPSTTTTPSADTKKGKKA